MAKKANLHDDQCHKAMAIAAAKGSTDTQQVIGTRRENGNQCHHQKRRIKVGGEWHGTEGSIGSGAARSSGRALFLAKRIERDHFGTRVV